MDIEREVYAFSLILLIISLKKNIQLIYFTHKKGHIFNQEKWHKNGNYTHAAMSIDNLTASLILYFFFRLHNIAAKIYLKIKINVFTKP